MTKAQKVVVAFWSLALLASFVAVPIVGRSGGDPDFVISVIVGIVAFGNLAWLVARKVGRGD
jgi:hypothetical protein